MAKTYSDLQRHALSGATMGTRWSALFHAPMGYDVVSLTAALQAAVDEVDAEMSTYKPDSDINRLNLSEPGNWVPLPIGLMTVLGAALVIGRASGGAFDIAMGDAVSAWGFSAAEADPEAIRKARARQRKPVADSLELDWQNRRACRHDDARFDLNGIAKGFGVDRLAEVAAQYGIFNGLFSIDGELRAKGHLPDGQPWVVAIEAPDIGRRSAHSVVELTDAAIATSGDYRHWISLGDHRLSHTMNPATGMPLVASPASVTVISEKSCMEADAWATAMMVLGCGKGSVLARQMGLSVLLLDQAGEKIGATGSFEVLDEVA
ncbi:FAD:protein FMN transferase [Martelella alba]|uniref:FAD:protein FMN transferase n=1 Tax=Martelella alba TaxID=2590451 RepID=UPI001F2D6416|nr:FAD:protein FMN transferase [Martelella alba]